MAEPLSLSTSWRRASASAAITSVVVVRPRPERPAATLGAGQSARVMRRLPVLRRPWSALLTSPRPRLRPRFCGAPPPAGRPGLCGLRQRRRDRSSTRMASGDARGRPQRSRHAAIAGLTAPLVGPVGIAMAGPPRLGRHRRAAKAGLPVPDRKGRTATAGPAPSRSVLDQNSQRRCSRYVRAIKTMRTSKLCELCG